jgi:DNA-binding NarL/FixJ family response regulator
MTPRACRGGTGGAAEVAGEFSHARVLVVDDHALLAETLASELRHAGCVVGVVRVPTVTGVLAAIDDFRPDVALLDLYLGRGAGTSLPLIAPLAESGIEVLVLTGATDELMLARCVEAGASAVLSKAAEFDVLLAAVVDAARGRRVQSLAERAEMLDRLRRARQDEDVRLAPFRRLTRRESAVLVALMDGRSAAEIAARAVVSLATVRSQIRAILQKLGVTSQIAAVAMAHRVGWTGPDGDELDDDESASCGVA